MSGNTDPPAHLWKIFSKELNRDCWFDPQRSEYVAQNGRRRAATALYAQEIMREHTDQQRQNASLGSSSRTISYSTAAGSASIPVPRTMTANDTRTGTLSEAFANLEVAPSSSRSDQPIQAGQSETLVRLGTNDRTGVTTIEQLGPTEVITDSEIQRMGIGANSFIRGSAGDEEQFDSNFKKRERKFFVPGKVFLSLWTEPLGGNTSANASTVINSGITTVRFGEMVFSKVRRFIVIREGDQSCTALPIFTYSYRGVAESTHKVSEHGLVYAGRVEPPSLHGEEAMQGVSIRIDPDIPGDKLDPVSRIHYGKVYTVEHNVKVKPFGMVNRDSLEPLFAQFRAVWVNNVGLRAQRRPVDREFVSVLERSSNTRLPPIPESGQRSRPEPGQPEPRRQAHGLTERQREALQEHGRAAEQRRPRRHGSVRSGSARSTGGQSNDGDDDNVPSLSTADQQRVQDVYTRVKQELMNRNVNADEAERRARILAAEKARQLLSATGSSSRPPGGPRSSSGSLVVGSPPRQGFQPPTPAITIPSSQTRTSSISTGQQQSAQLPPSSLPTRYGQGQLSGSSVLGSSPPASQPQQIQQRATSTSTRHAQASSSRTPTMGRATPANPSSSSSARTSLAGRSSEQPSASNNGTVTVQGLMGLGYSQNAATNIRQLVDQGLSLATAITVSNRVEQGYTMRDAIASVTRETRAASKK